MVSIDMGNVQYKIFTLLTLFCTISHLSFAEKVEDINNEKEKIEYSYKPSAFNFGVDIFSPAYNYYKHGFKYHKYNIHNSIDINRIFIDLDYGFIRFHKQQPETIPDEYQLFKGMSSDPQQFDDSLVGGFGSIGFSYNFLSKNIEHNAIFMGLGYSLTFFKEKFTGSIRSTQPHYAPTVCSETTLFFDHWFNVVLGLRLSLNRFIYIGHSSQINFWRFPLKALNENEIRVIPYYIPGFGEEESEIGYDFRLFIGFNIELWDDPKLKMKELSL